MNTSQILSASSTQTSPLTMLGFHSGSTTNSSSTGVKQGNGGLFIQFAKNLAFLGGMGLSGYLIGAFSYMVVDTLNELNVLKQEIIDMKSRIEENNGIYNGYFRGVIEKLKDQENDLRMMISLRDDKINKKISEMHSKVQQDVSQLKEEIKSEHKGSSGSREFDSYYKLQKEELERLFKQQKENLIDQKQEIINASKAEIDQTTTAVGQIKTQTLHEMNEIKKQQKEYTTKVFKLMKKIVQQYTTDMTDKLKKIDDFYVKLKDLDGELRLSRSNRTTV